MGTTKTYNVTLLLLSFVFYFVKIE